MRKKGIYKDSNGNVFRNGVKLSIPSDFESKKSKYTVPMSSIDDEIEGAKDIIKEEMSGKQLGLKTRFESLDISNSKYFRFEEFTLLAGLSGAGKSYMLNMILDDFMDKEGINKNFEKEVIIAHFGYEQSPAKELIRSVSSSMKKSYSYLLSSQWDSKTKTYNRINDLEIDRIKKELDSKKGKPFFFAKDTGSFTQMYYTVYDLANRFPNAEIVISNDHTLLNKRSSKDTSEVELLANGAKMGAKLKKDFSALVFWLGQLNGNIEKIERLGNPNMHYPIKTDIFGSSQIYQALDNCYVLHRPEIINIPFYGQDELPTTGLAHLAGIKNRNGDPANIWLEAALGQGTFIERRIEDFANANFNM